jgi:hypothetical protein
VLLGEGSTTLPDLRRVGSFHTMHEFGQRDGGNGNLDFAKELPDFSQELFDYWRFRSAAMITLGVED